MKRNPALIPLSHDHHHGLVVSRRIAEGLRKGAEAPRIGRYVIDFWERDLSRHFDQEEKILLPLLEAQDPLGRRVLEEHTELRRHIAELQSGSFADLGTFGQLLEAHIRFEERILFPHLEQSLTPIQISEAGAALQPEHAEGPECWPDPFWTASPIPGNNE